MKLRNFRWQVFQVARRRRRDGTWLEEQLSTGIRTPPIAPKPPTAAPPLQVRPPAPLFPSTSGSASSSGPAPPQTPAEPPGPVPGGPGWDEMNRRWLEESQYRAMLDEMDWADFIPDSETARDSLANIGNLAQEYVRCFMHSSTRPASVQDWPRHMRAWLAEWEWTLRSASHRGWLPKSMTNPGDRHIRTLAGQSADNFQDPGNLRLDELVHVGRLWRFVDATRRDMVMRTPAGDYGSARNKSSVGPVNLRGNIVEASCLELQRWGSEVG